VVFIGGGGGPAARIGDDEGEAHEKVAEKGRDMALTREAEAAVAFDFTPMKRGSPTAGGRQYVGGQRGCSWCGRSGKGKGTGKWAATRATPFLGGVAVSGEKAQKRGSGPVEGATWFGKRRGGAPGPIGEQAADSGPQAVGASEWRAARLKNRGGGAVDRWDRMAQYWSVGVK
jgi:hypothetical protein